MSTPSQEEGILYTVEDLQIAEHEAEKAYEEAYGSLLACQKAQATKRIELRERLRQVESEIQALNEEIRPYLLEVSKVNEKICDLQDNIEDLKSDLAHNKAKAEKHIQEMGYSLSPSE